MSVRSAFCYGAHLADFIFPFFKLKNVFEFSIIFIFYFFLHLYSSNKSKEVKLNF